MMKLLTSIALIVSVLFAFFSQSVLAATELPENPPITNKVYLDIEEDGKSLGRITIGLFGTVVPKLLKISVSCVLVKWVQVIKILFSIVLLKIS